ncbi:HEAT repeat domain-containing protein [Aphanothece sacrum]|uniref:Peptidoglycan-binding domain-containing protein n=1 Tax=Aphanothece sacrum FPU1 TaxID=1920663 RepID=A0A401IGR1_APHSA|nr:HEAT repeat domain-containing protein [Aphanothece sacrum]GBF80448.1 peptidoglycan-binding domain-containing protein [Aphanothece sacrum FPU1]GBF85529.1 peptidoglycan-binding domain-containing protein [Aphanothece sacrum FPU3]
MNNYRFTVLIIIYLACLGWTPNNTRSFSVSNSTIIGREITQVAQVRANNSAKNSLSQQDNSAYRNYMKAGYRAAKEKEYQKALEKFNQALKDRPEDIYAQQAIQNVEFYLAKNANPLTSNNNFLLVLLVGLIIITIALGIMNWFLFRRLSFYSPNKSKTELFESSKKLKEDDEVQEIDLELDAEETHDYSENNGVNTTVVSQVLTNETALQIQSTTRIPSRDPLEILIQDLKETDPKKRRKAIWELAQKSDSRAMKPLVDLMIDTDSQERTLILEALSQISARTLKPMNQALAISLQDKNPQVRKNAIRDLTRVYELMSQISQLLCHAIDDVDIDVKETAKWAVNQINMQMPPRLDILNRNSPPEITVEQSYSDSKESN